MSTERIDVEALRGRSDIVRVTAEGTREAAAQCSAHIRSFMYLRAAELEQIAGEYDALLAEVIERRARDAAVAELVEATNALVGPPLRYRDATIEVDCSDHSTAMQVVARVRNAIAAIQGAQP